MAMKPDVAARLDRQNAKPQLPAFHAGKLAAEVYGGRLPGRQPFIACWSIRSMRQIGTDRYAEDRQQSSAKDIALAS